MNAPQSIAELADAVRSFSRVLPIGAQTKPRLCASDAERITTSQLRGITEYDPAEFTFTALAGTPLAEIEAALTEQGQYLPFDPPLAAAGATLGGTVAAGLSGPGRFRFGGVRDFILGVRFIDGLGRVLRLGGKVVKNAAGFDLPKFFCGSLGRFGVLAEITFKVFPQAAASRTLIIDAADATEAARIVQDLARTRWEPDAIDVLPGGCRIAIRLAAPEKALPALTDEILQRWTGQAMADDEATRLWSDLQGFLLFPANAGWIKAPLTPDQIPALTRDHPGTAIHISAGGNLAWLATDQLHPAWRGLTLRGQGPLWQGARSHSQMEIAVKQALDPSGRFPSLDD